MQFYYWPIHGSGCNVLWHQTSISLVVKKPNRLAFLPGFDLFKEALGAKKGIRYNEFSQENDFLSFLQSFDGFYSATLLESFLRPISKLIGNVDMSGECIQAIRDEYLEEQLEEWSMSSFEDGDFFALGDDQIRELYRILFHPSQMAIIVTGCFDLTGLEEELENTFGRIQRDEVLGDDLPKKAKIPYARHVELFLDEDDDEFSSDASFGYEYIYAIEPSYTNLVLRDLWRVIGEEKGMILPEKPWNCLISSGYQYPYANHYPVESFRTRKKITDVACSKTLFDFAKKELCEV